MTMRDLINRPDYFGHFDPAKKTGSAAWYDLSTYDEGYVKFIGLDEHEETVLVYEGTVNLDEDNIAEAEAHAADDNADRKFIVDLVRQQVGHDMKPWGNTYRNYYYVEVELDGVEDRGTIKAMSVDGLAELIAEQLW